MAFLAPRPTGAHGRSAATSARPPAYYEWVIGDGPRIPILERSLAWLADNLPADEGPPVLSWGDARIGNVIYRDFAPVGVLDWEMAGVAPARWTSRG